MDEVKDSAYGFTGWSNIFDTDIYIPPFLQRTQDSGLEDYYSFLFSQPHSEIDLADRTSWCMM